MFAFEDYLPLLTEINTFLDDSYCEFISNRYNSYSEYIDSKSMKRFLNELKSDLALLLESLDLMKPLAKYLDDFDEFKEAFEKVRSCDKMVSFEEYKKVIEALQFHVSRYHHYVITTPVFKGPIDFEADPEARYALNEYSDLNEHLSMKEKFYNRIKRSTVIAPHNYQEKKEMFCLKDTKTIYFPVSNIDKKPIYRVFKNHYDCLFRCISSDITTMNLIPILSVGHYETVPFLTLGFLAGIIERTEDLPYSDDWILKYIKLAPFSFSALSVAQFKAKMRPWKRRYRIFLDEFRTSVENAFIYYLADICGMKADAREAEGNRGFWQ